MSFTIVPGSERCYATTGDSSPDLSVSASSFGEEPELARLRRTVERGEQAEAKIENATFAAFRAMRNGPVPESEQPEPSSAEDAVFRAWRAWQGRAA